MSIILLRGYSHSGKDFVGNVLCNEYGYTRFAFADSLKKMVAETFGCPLELLHTQEGKLQVCDSDILKRTYRQILIDEALRLRTINPNVFAEHCCKEIKESDKRNIVITDWRYSNELDTIISEFPNIFILPVHLIRLGQERSPVDDISEYQLNDRVNDWKLYNPLNESLRINIKSMILFIESVCHNK